MRWRPQIFKRKESAPDVELQKKRMALKKKEMELVRKERDLSHKIKQFKKFSSRKKSHAKSDIKAAKRLRSAKKKLIFALDTKDKRKGKKRKHTKKVSKRRKKKESCCRKRKKPGLLEAFRASPAACIGNVLTQPCTCYCSPAARRANFRSQSRTVDPSCMRKLFGGPCGCSSNRGRTPPPLYKRLLGFQTCRCEFPNTRERPNYGAGGDCYLMTLRQTPQMWIYHRWPHLYPRYLGARHQWMNLRHCLLSCAAVIFWMPCFLCLELCKCFFCACCTE